MLGAVFQLQEAFVGCLTLFQRLWSSLLCISCTNTFCRSMTPMAGSTFSRLAKAIAAMEVLVPALLLSAAKVILFCTCFCFSVELSACHCTLLLLRWASDPLEVEPFRLSQHTHQDCQPCRQSMILIIANMSFLLAEVLFSILEMLLRSSSL